MGVAKYQKVSVCLPLPIYETMRCPMSLDEVYDWVDSVIKDLRESYMISLTHPNPVLNRT